jgi:hypothetical protein
VRPTLAALALWIVFGVDSAPAAEAESGLVAFVDAVEKPSIGAELLVPERLTLGRAELRPSTSTRLFALEASGRRCGLLWLGDAELSYRVEDPFSRRIAKRNFDRARGFRLREEDGATLATAPMRAAAIWGLGFDLPVREHAPPPPAELPSWLAQHLRKKVSPNPAREMALAAWNGHSGFRWALFHGASDDFVLEVDPRPAVATETLLRIEKVGAPPSPISTGRWGGNVITQPIGRPWWSPPELDVVIVAVDLEVVNPRGELVEIRSRTTVRAQRDATRLVALGLPNWTRDDKHGWHPLDLVSLLVDGRPAPHVHRATALLVELPRPLAAGESFVLETRVRGELLYRPGGNTYWLLAGAWHPTPLGDGTTWASFRFTVDAPHPFVPRVGGRTVSRTSDGGRNRVEATLSGPMSFPAVVAGRYETATYEESGRKVHVSRYAARPDADAERVARSVLAIQRCYESWFGVPYPFDELELVEIAAWGWGMAPPGMIFVTLEAFLGKAEKRAARGLVKRAIEGAVGGDLRLAHEVAHGWFPHVAKAIDPEEAWLSESIADYVAAVCLQHSHDNRARGDERFSAALTDWKDRTRQLDDGASLFLYPHLDPTPEKGHLRTRLLYGKGPLVLHALRQELARHAKDAEAGDRLFFDWMRSIVQTFANQRLTTRGIVDLLERQTGVAWWPWFERYVFGIDTPRID